jgi:hypothetical protein
MPLALWAFITSCSRDSDTGGNGSGGGELSLEGYLRNVVEINSKYDDPPVGELDLDPLASFKERQTALLDWTSELEAVFIGPTDDLSGLNPPDEAQASHDELLQSISEL